MRYWLLFPVLSLLPVFALAQESGEAAPAAAQAGAETPAPAPEATPAATPPAPPTPAANWRDTTGYLYPAIATTVAAAQNMAYAMQLRDYCANPKVPDDFVRARLDRFARITGREETCQSLLDY
ncbi:hypothetical protein AGMMS49543_16940 [Betaproteobacteria bacterium]|nr:hypothetical protein AGMMS49543_16940 [Betaproteobacteria bacterium]GHU16649.1 hypothetical protein AGMMS50243_03280 [Betaproteobacteria bacterium]